MRVALRDPRTRARTRQTEKCVVRLTRLQLEQDSGKSVNTLHPQFTLVDLNRAGVALMEICD